MTEQEKPESSRKVEDADRPAAGTPPDGDESGSGEEAGAPAAAGESKADDEITHTARASGPEAPGGKDAEAGEPASGAGPATDTGTGSESGAEAEAPAPADDSAPPPPVAGSRAGGLAWIALVLALVAVVLGAFQWWSGRAAGDVGQQVEQSVGALRSELGRDLADGENSLRALAGRVDALEAAVARAADASRLTALERRFEASADIMESLPGRIQNMEESLANLQGISAGARDAWLVAEAEYYMQLANAQAQLAGNAELAAFALELADRRIRELADPSYTPVRRQLATEITALRSVASVDVEGVSLSLASLGEIVQSLPLDDDITPEAEGRQAPDTELTGAARAWAAVKGAFSDVVRVRRSDEALRPLLSPEAQYFLRTNLALQMQTARLALLKGEDEVFRQSLDDAEAWLRRYFDDEDQAVTAAIATIGEIRRSEVSTELPDVSGSLRLFRQQRQLAEETE